MNLPIKLIHTDNGAVINAEVIINSMPIKTI